MIDTDDLRRHLTAELRHAAQATGDGRYSLAAGILAGRRPGRPRLDDTGAVAEIRALLEAGIAKNSTDAARMVAKTRHEHATLESVTKRMAAAYRKAQSEN